MGETMNKREEVCPAWSSACALIVREGSLVLAVWNEKHKCWGLPGGKRESNDNDIRATARRELVEEVGLYDPHLTWLYAGEYQMLPDSSAPAREVHLYHARLVYGDPQPKETEIAWWRWSWLLNAAPAFVAFYQNALPDGIDHLKPTEFRQ
jgi:8-oxo-dGTP pyrophosphatase MutT (NUDIX family)